MRSSTTSIPRSRKCQPLPANSRQIFHRAKVRVEKARPPKVTEAAGAPAGRPLHGGARGRRRRLRGGLLAENVVWVADGGGKAPAAKVMLEGRDRVAALLRRYRSRGSPGSRRVHPFTCAPPRSTGSRSLWWTVASTPFSAARSATDASSGFTRSGIRKSSAISRRAPPRASDGQAALARGSGSTIFAVVPRPRWMLGIRQHPMVWRAASWWNYIREGRSWLIF